MAKGQGKVVAEIKRRIMILQLKKQLKQALSYKERKSNQSVMVKYNYEKRSSEFVTTKHGFPICTLVHMIKETDFNHDPLRSRKLLLHKKQISTLIGQTKEQGFAIVPIKMYLKDGFAKVLIGVGKGKKDYDKREDLKKKEAKREMARALKDKQRY